MTGAAEYTYERLRDIAASVGDRSGWDFSHMRTDREPVPWDYMEVVPRHLQPTDSVLDIGTGGGEKLLALARYFGTGVGIDPDPEMIQTARRNGTAQPKVSFVEMGAEALAFSGESFDVVLNRHAPIFVPEVTRVLKPGGYVVTQQVGKVNMANIRSEFGTERDFASRDGNALHDDDHRALCDEPTKHGCRIIATGAYNVRYWVKDIPSLIFWFKALAGGNEIPEGFSIDRDWQTVNRIITTYSTPLGVQTNEHRTLLVAQKPT